MKIAWVVPTQDMRSGSAWYRCIEPAKIAVASGLAECWVADKLYIGDRGPVLLLDELYKPIEPDLFVMRPNDVITDEMLQRMAEHGQRLVLTMDDDPWAFWQQVELGGYNQLAAAAAEMWCSTEVLRDNLAARFPSTPCRLVPNAYDPQRYRQRDWRCPPRLGWHAALQGREASDLFMLYDHVPDGVLNVHVGGPELPMRKGIDERPYVPIEELPHALDFEIGLVVMADTAFNAAKTETKGFELGAAGIPFLAMTGPHPLYRSLPGYVTPEDFMARLRELRRGDVWHKAQKAVRKWAFWLAQGNRGAVAEAIAAQELVDA